jgi:hypothetical protein
MKSDPAGLPKLVAARDASDRISEVVGAAGTGLVSMTEPLSWPSGFWMKLEPVGQEDELRATPEQYWPMIPAQGLPPRSVKNPVMYDMTEAWLGACHSVPQKST